MPQGTRTKQQVMTQARPKAMVLRMSRMSRTHPGEKPAMKVDTVNMAMADMDTSSSVHMSNMSKVSKVSMDMPCHQLKVLHVGRPCRVTCVRTIEIRLVHSCFFRLSPHPHWNDLSQSNWLDLGTIRFQKDRFHLNFALDSGQQ